MTGPGLLFTCAVLLAGAALFAGRKVRTRAMDLLIAATARAHQVPLYTRNRQDFDPLKALIEIRSA
jgi:predicted nucleic acid-binding protein